MAPRPAGTHAGRPAAAPAHLHAGPALSHPAPLPPALTRGEPPAGSHQHSAPSLPPAPRRDTPTFTHTRTHTPTRTSCVYPGARTQALGDGVQPKQRSVVAPTPTLPPRGASSSRPSAGKEAAPGRGRAGRAGDRERGEMEGEEDSVRHSVSQSGRAEGDWALSLVGGGGETTRAMQNVGGGGSRSPRG